MTTSRLRAGAATTLFIAVSACGLTGHESLDPEDYSPSQYLRAVVNGAAFDARDRRVSLQNSTLTISGDDAYKRRIAFNIHCTSEDLLSGLPRTFLFAESLADSVGFAQYSEIRGLIGVFYATTETGARGSLTVTALSADRIAGTFSFVAPLSSGPGGGSMTVNSGEFAIKF